MMLSFRRFLFVALLAAVAQGVAVNSAQGAFTVDFDAVPTNDFVNGFYNGGTSSGGASGPNLGVDFLAGDWFTPTGFGQTSQPNSAFSQSGSGSVNVAAGFTSQFGFTYGEFSPTTISIWSGLNGTGTLLAITPLPVNNVHAFDPVVITFAGTAQSVTISSGSGQFLWDDLSFGPASATPAPPTAVAAIVALLAFVPLSRFRRRTGKAESAVGV